MKRRSASLKGLLACLLVLISGCGGGGGGGSSSGGSTGPAPVTLEAGQLALFPMTNDFAWFYNYSSSATKFTQDLSIQGHKVRVLQHPTKAKEYFFTTLSSLHYFGIYMPQITVATSEGYEDYSANVTLETPITLFDSNWAPGTHHTFSGKGAMHIQPTYGNRAIGFSGSLDYVGVEDVTYGAKTYQAHHVSYEFTLSLNIEGQTLKLPMVTELWLAPNVGIIKRRENGGLLNLTDAHGLPASTSFHVVEGAPELPETQTLQRDLTPLLASEYDAQVTYANTEEDWLQLSVNESGVYTIVPKTNTLAAGEHVATIAFESPGHWPYELSVRYFVEEPHLIGPDSLVFDLSTDFDNTDLTQTLTLANTGAPVSLSIDSDASWVTLVDQTVNPATPVYQVSINPNAFFATPTSATATVYVTYDNGYRDNNKLYVPVIVQLPAQAFGTDAIDFTNISGESDLPAAIALSWLNQPVPAQHYTSAVTYAEGTGNWLNVFEDENSGALQTQIRHNNLTPGIHSATITLTDTDGFSVVYEVTFTIDPPYMTTPTALAYDIDENTLESELTQTFTLQMIGGPLQWSISSSESWLVATQTSNDDVNGYEVQLQIAVADIEALPDGHYEATVTIEYDNDFIDPVVVDVPVSVDITFPKVTFPLPYVVYENKAATIAVNGSGFNALPTRQLILDNTPISPLNIIDDRELHVELAGLSAGEHVLYVDNALGLQRASGRLLVKAEPAYADTEISVPGRVESMAYDEEREAFFGVFLDLNIRVNNVARIQYQTDHWQVDPIDIGEPTAISLTADGKTLLVTDNNCTVHEVNPDTLQIIKSTLITECYLYDILGLITQFNTGEILVGNIVGGSVWRYPSQEVTSIGLTGDAVVDVSRMRNKMVVAQLPSYLGYRPLYIVDSKTEISTEVDVVGDDYFARDYIGLNADGSRLLISKDVYDKNQTYIGSLDIADPYFYSTTRPTPDGHYALAFDNSAESIRMFDISGTSGPFPELGSSLAMPSSLITTMTDMHFPLPGDIVFMFGYTGSGYSDNNEHRMVIRNLTFE
ncbi:MAG: hypothetical protein CMK89_12235 [Pseudomonadales bacterium]|nr:hypothetical protein [Pseudomonadales bacterium]